MTFSSVEWNHKAFLVDGSLSKQGNDVIVAGGQVTDYPEANGKVLAEGTVVVLEDGDGMAYLADGADGVSAGDISTAAAIESSEAPDDDWKSKTITWTVYYPNGMTVSGTVVAGGTDADADAFVALCNDPDTAQGAAFLAHLVASKTNGTKLTVTTKAKGHVQLKLTCDLATAYGTAAGQTDRGTSADVRVMAQGRPVALFDINGDDLDSKPLANLTCGYFRRSELSNLSPEAEAILRERGSRFDTD